MVILVIWLFVGDKILTLVRQIILKKMRQISLSSFFSLQSWMTLVKLQPADYVYVSLLSSGSMFIFWLPLVYFRSSAFILIKILVSLAKMTELEQQSEEIETLLSIYDGDTNFKQVNNSTFQYKVKKAWNYQIIEK